MSSQFNIPKVVFRMTDPHIVHFRTLKVVAQTANTFPPGKQVPQDFAQPDPAFSPWLRVPGAFRQLGASFPPQFPLRNCICGCPGGQKSFVCEVWYPMLDLLRKAAKTYVAKALFILLIASFGIWGAAQRMEHGTSSTVMTVGSQEIDIPEFRFAYQSQVSNLSQQLGSQLSTEQAKAFGVEQQVFAQLSAGATMDQLAKDMKLGPVAEPPGATDCRGPGLQVGQRPV